MKARGLSLIELLVAVAIIGIMVALVLPAIQASREAARRLGCINHLKQIGLATENYLSSSGVFPQSGSWPSVHSRLLPYLEMNNLYDSLNFESDYPFSPEQHTTLTWTVSGFLCPSDSASRDGPLGMTSYAANAGYGLDVGANPLENGPYSYSCRKVRPADVTDGLTTTCAFAEWVIGPTNPLKRDSRGTIFLGPVYTELESFSAGCRALDTSVAAWGGGKGWYWSVNSSGSTLYNNLLTPNGHSCRDPHGSQGGAWTAGSRHPGGASTLYLDGHVSFVRDSIAPATWRAIGTIRGGEVVSQDD